MSLDVDAESPDDGRINDVADDHDGDGKKQGKGEAQTGFQQTGKGDEKKERGEDRPENLGGQISGQMPVAGVMIEPEDSQNRGQGKRRQDGRQW